MWSETGPLRYERLTWPEVRRAAGEDRVALVPVATGSQMLGSPAGQVWLPLGRGDPRRLLAALAHPGAW